MCPFTFRHVNNSANSRDPAAEVTDGQPSQLVDPLRVYPSLFQENSDPGGVVQLWYVPESNGEGAYCHEADKCIPSIESTLASVDLTSVDLTSVGAEITIGTGQWEICKFQWKESTMTFSEKVLNNEPEGILKIAPLEAKSLRKTKPVLTVLNWKRIKVEGEALQ
jgi:hypothetical protein